jgi:DnaJ-class molecular chaperone
VTGKVVREQRCRRCAGTGFSDGLLSLCVIWGDYPACRACDGTGLEYVTFIAEDPRVNPTAYPIKVRA